MKKVIQLTIILMSALYFVSSASAASYWSVGSFSQQDNAERERARISHETGMNVEVVRSGSLYRVVVAKDSDPDIQKSMLEAVGLSPWSLPDDNVEPVAVPAMAKNPEPVQTGFSLVLASFLDEISAETLQERLAQDGIEDLSVMSAVVNGRTYYRLLQGPYSDRAGVNTDFSAYGIGDTWWMASSTPVAVADVVMERADPEPAEPIGVVEVGTMPETPPEPVYTISPPGAGESYINYCLRRANKMERAIYCKDGDFNRISNAERRLRERGESHDYCALTANSRERKQKCRNNQG